MGCSPLERAAHKIFSITLKNSFIKERMINDRLVRRAILYQIVDIAIVKFTSNSIYIENDRDDCPKKTRPYIDYTSYSQTYLTHTNGKGPCFLNCKESIKDVIFNPPATIILWMDGSKTIVKTQNGEPFDPEKGFAMAVIKKVFGNKGNYYNPIRKWVSSYKPKSEENSNDITK